MFTEEKEKEQPDNRAMLAALVGIVGAGKVKDMTKLDVNGIAGGGLPSNLLGNLPSNLPGGILQGGGDLGHLAAKVKGNISQHLDKIAPGLDGLKEMAQSAMSLVSGGVPLPTEGLGEGFTLAAKPAQMFQQAAQSGRNLLGGMRG